MSDASPWLSMSTGVSRSCFDLRLLSQGLTCCGYALIVTNAWQMYRWGTCAVHADCLALLVCACELVN